MIAKAWVTIIDDEGTVCYYDIAQDGMTLTHNNYGYSSWSGGSGPGITEIEIQGFVTSAGSYTVDNLAGHISDVLGSSDWDTMTEKEKDIFKQALVRCIRWK